MINLRLKHLAIGLLFCSPLSYASPLYLNEAFNFNAYIIEDMTAEHSDVEGQLAVGGNFSAQDYSVGLQSADNGQNILTVGGDVYLRDARIYNGDAVAGGNIDIDASVGLYNEDQTNNSHTFYQDSSFDFSTVSADLLSTSSLWGAMTDTATTAITGNGTDVWSISFNGNSDFNVFSIDADTLSASDKSIYLNVTSDSLNIINVFGDTVDLFNTGFFGADGTQIRDNQPGVYRSNGLFANNVLFNFVDATSLSLNAIAFKGSILAPLADTVFYDGQIDGNFIVKSLSSPIGEFTGQINDYRFGDLSFNVDEPGGALFIVMLVALGIRQTLLKKKVL